MVIGAHPDDAEFAMGGTIAKYSRAGAEVLVVDITNGEPTPYGSPEKRKVESENSAKTLGVKRKTLPFDNRFLFDTVEVRKAVAGEIRLFRPDILFIHYPEDAHPDHWSASAASMASRFYGKLSHIDLPGERFFVPRVFYFFAVHLRISPTPSFCLDISDTIEQKLEAILSYKSQFHEIDKKFKARNLAHQAEPEQAPAGNNKNAQKENDQNKEDTMKRFITTLNGYWGQRSGVAYAEPFFSPEILGLKDLSNLVL